MEPMTLGSPSNISQGFTPSFLMGELLVAPTSMAGAVDGRMGSPQPRRNTRRVSFAPDSPHPTSSLSPDIQPTMHSKLMTPNRQGSGNETPRKGPPIVSLFDTLPSTSPLANQSSFSFNQTNQTLNTSFLGSSLRADTNENTNTSALYLDSGLYDREETDRWVTVFGFPSSMSNAVFTWLSTCGTITVRYLPASSRANWLHIRFSSPAEAIHALGRNQHMLGPDTLVGVVPCIDKSVIREFSRKSQQGMNESFYEAGGNFLFSSQSTQQSVHNNTSYSTNLNSSLRSLAASPDIAVEPAILPRRTSGILSKTLDFVMGW